MAKRKYTRLEDRPRGLTSTLPISEQRKFYQRLESWYWHASRTPEQKAVLAARASEYRRMDPEKYRAKALAAYYRKLSTPEGKVAHRVRAAIKRWAVGCGRNNKRTGNLAARLGYTAADLKRHLERQFVRGMSWENYGSRWHIDHIIPLASFSLTGFDDPNFHVAWGLPNLRPLWAGENCRKSWKRTLLL